MGNFEEQELCHFSFALARQSKTRGGLDSYKRQVAETEGRQNEVEEEEEIIRLPWRGSVVGLLLAARALPLRCAPSPPVLTICIGYA
jgi:hypothetical protein